MGHAARAPTATSGLPGLDGALGGLLRGENVLWTVEGQGCVEPFYRAVTRTNGTFDRRLYVTMTESPQRVAARFGDVVVIDARPGGPLGQPAPLLDHVHRRVREGRRPLVLLDPIESMVSAWGAALTSRFVARCTVLLLDLNSVAYWSVHAGEVPARLYRQTQDEAQCALVVDADRLRVTKAEGHPASAAGTVLVYQLDGGLPADVREAPAAQRLGTALRVFRQRRNLTQHDLGRIAGVSASAISQAERGHRGLSFATLLELTSHLGISFEELLDARLAKLRHRVGRRREWAGDVARMDRLLHLDEAGRAVCVARLPAGQSLSPPPRAGCALLVVAASGVVEVSTAGSRCVLRAGDVMAIDGTGLDRLRDLGAGSTVFVATLGAAAPP